MVKMGLERGGLVLASRASLVAQIGNESACNAEDSGSVLGSGRSPGGGNGNPLQYSCLRNPHEPRSLVGYSAWGRKETRLSTNTF